MARLQEGQHDHERRLGAINGHVDRLANAYSDMRVTVSRIAVGAGVFVVLSNLVTALIVFELSS